MAAKVAGFLTQTGQLHRGRGGAVPVTASAELLSSHCSVLTFLLETKVQPMSALTLVHSSGRPYQEEKGCVILSSTRESSFQQLPASVLAIPAHELLGFNPHFSSPGYFSQ